MKLFLIHCGFYDTEIFEGVYESHANFFVVAESFDDARAKAKSNPVFAGKRMHIDGLQQLDAIDGHRIRLDLDPSLAGRTEVLSNRHRDLAPKPPQSSNS